MKSPSDNILETLLDRLDAGESLASIQKDLGAEVGDYVEVLAFLTAQKTSLKPDPNNLTQALRQASLIETQASGDEWGSFSRAFASWKPWVGVSLSLFGVGIMTANWWSVTPPESVASKVEETMAFKTAEAPAADFMMMDEAAPMMARSNLDSVVVDEDMALLQAWEDDFALEMEDFNNTKATLESLYSDPLFSALTPTQS